MAIKYIGFDLDGTLASEEFDKLVWNKEIPQLYAKKNNLSIKDAEDQVYADYFRLKYITPNPEWTNVEFWFKHFGLKLDAKQMMKDLKSKVFVYKDVMPALDSLSKKYKLVVLSNAHPTFLETKLEVEGLSSYFEKAFSTYVINNGKKTASAFSHVLNDLGIKASEFVYVGNDHDDDYVAPSSIGIRSFFLDRDKKGKDDYVVYDLKQFVKKL